MQSKEARLEQLLPLIEEKLGQGQSVRFMPMGVSMLPMLRQGRDSVVLSPAPKQLKKYDLPLYRRDNGKFVLHRIVKVDDTYTCIGDNQFQLEYGVRQDQVIAVVSAFCRGTREISVESFGYKLYCRVWNRSRGLRHFWQRGKNFLRRHLTRVSR